MEKGSFNHVFGSVVELDFPRALAAKYADAHEHHVPATSRAVIAHGAAGIGGNRKSNTVAAKAVVAAEAVSIQVEALVQLMTQNMRAMEEEKKARLFSEEKFSEQV